MPIFSDRGKRRAILHATAPLPRRLRLSARYRLLANLEVGKASVKRFSTLPTQFARYVVVPEGLGQEDEEAFMAYAVEQLRELGIKVRKLLCGRGHAIRHPDGDVHTRSLMLADLDVEEAVTLQQRGIGDHRTMGCGLFIPHKGIRAVHKMTADKQS